MRSGVRSKSSIWRFLGAVLVTSCQLDASGVFECGVQFWDGEGGVPHSLVLVGRLPLAEIRSAQISKSDSMNSDTKSDQDVRNSKNSNVLVAARVVSFPLHLLSGLHSRNRRPDRSPDAHTAAAGLRSYRSLSCQHKRG